MTKLLVIPSAEFATTYSGTRYLLTELSQRDIDVRVFLRIPPEKRGQYVAFPFKVSFFTWWSPKWPKGMRLLSIALYRGLVFLKALRARMVLTTESFYLPEIAWAKKLNRRLKVIDFCQELNLISETPKSAAARFYARYAKDVDLTIDVEPHRANLRQKAIGLKECPLVLLNTVPLSLVTCNESLSNLADTELPKDCPIVLYAGGISTEKPFSRIISAVASQKNRCFLMAFCATTPELLLDAKRQAEQHLQPGSFCIHSGVSHRKILAAMHEANIGLVDYAVKVENTSNQRFCAPTKLYEYLAAGLAVVGSANESIRCVVESNDAGACAANDDDAELGVALGRVLLNYQKMQVNARKAFEDKYAYEKCCVPVVEEIVRWIRCAS